LNGEQIIKGNVTSAIDKVPVVTQFYIDGPPDTLAGKAFSTVAEYIAKIGISEIAVGVGAAEGAVAGAPLIVSMMTGYYAFDIWAGYELFYGLEQKFISINRVDEKRKPGETCYTIYAVTANGRSLKEDPSGEYCENNKKCCDITVRRSYYAEDYSGNHKRQYFDVKVKANSCNDGDICTEDICKNDCNCEHIENALCRNRKSFSEYRPACQ
jgi:hypothetical protein